MMIQLQTCFYAHSDSWLVKQHHQHSNISKLHASLLKTRQKGHMQTFMESKSSWNPSERGFCCSIETTDVLRIQRINWWHLSSEMYPSGGTFTVWKWWSCKNLHVCEDCVRISSYPSFLLLRGSSDRSSTHPWFHMNLCVKLQHVL